MDPELMAIVEAEEWKRMNCDRVYRERNRLVATLTKLSMLSDHVHIVRDESEVDEWHIVYIEGPTGQMSWHVPKSDMDLFHGREIEEYWPWDGHTTDEKYDRLSRLGL